MKNTKTYETVIRGKWIYGEAKTFDEMIAGLNSTAEYLAKLRDAGCELCSDGAADDYFFVTTSKKSVAKKFRMSEISDDKE
jgi:hypothetical protein